MNNSEAIQESNVSRGSTVYLLTLLSVLGVFAAVSAVLLAWPALAYLGAKLI